MFFFLPCAKKCWVVHVEKTDWAETVVGWGWGWGWDDIVCGLAEREERERGVGGWGGGLCASYLHIIHHASVCWRCV